MRDAYIGTLIRELADGPLTIEGIEKALYATWSHGASTALLMPAFAYSQLGEPRRRAFARMLIGGIAVASGLKPTHYNELSEFVDRQMEREEIIPLISEPPELLGARVEN